MSTFNMVTALKQGDSSVFSDLFHEYHRKVYLYVLSKSHSSYIAEEATQITFIKLWDYRQQLDEAEPVSKLIFHIARATTIDLLRKEANKGKLLRQERVVQMATGDVSSLVEAREMLLRVRQVVERMPPVRRKVFEMSRYEFKSYKEIAAQLSLSVKTVENHMSLAINQLRNFILLLLLFILL